MKIYLLKKAHSKNQQIKTGNLTKDHHSIETFIEATRCDIQEKNEKTRPSTYLNLTIKEWKAMLEPQSRNDVVITEAARGEAVVVLDYIKEAERNLNNRENCRKISYNPSTANNKTILKVI